MTRVLARAEANSQVRPAISIGMTRANADAVVAARLPDRCVGQLIAVEEQPLPPEGLVARSFDRGPYTLKRI